jgi:hypothetical protein
VHTELLRSKQGQEDCATNIPVQSVQLRQLVQFLQLVLLPLDEVFTRD